MGHYTWTLRLDTKLEIKIRLMVQVGHFRWIMGLDTKLELELETLVPHYSWTLKIHTPVRTMELNTKVGH